jgi:micrococcal nuclease
MKNRYRVEIYDEVKANDLTIYSEQGVDKEYLTELIIGKSVKLLSDIDSLDQYGRTLSYVYLEDGTFINAELVKNGYAMIMTVPPNVKYADLFLELQIEARENNRGLWKE